MTPTTAKPATMPVGRRPFLTLSRADTEIGLSLVFCCGVMSFSVELVMGDFGSLELGLFCALGGLESAKGVVWGVVTGGLGAGGGVESVVNGAGGET